MEIINNKVEVGKLFLEVSKILKCSMRRRFEEFGITMPQGMLIGKLHESGKLKISELSTELGLSNSTISGIIDRLEKQQIVSRERSLVDKRIVYVTLSPQFAEMHHNFHQKSEEGFEKLLDKGTKEEIEKIVEGLNVLKRILNQHEQ